jgi:hypothetical protein
MAVASSRAPIGGNAAATGQFGKAKNKSGKPARYDAAAISTD